MEPIKHGCPITEKVWLGVSAARFDALKAAGEPIPPPLQLRAVVDTGAMFSMVDHEIIAALGLESIGTYGFWTPGGHSHSTEFFRCSIYIDHWSLGAMAVASESLREPHNLDMFLGRDVLQYLLFTYDPRNGVFTLLAPNPGL